MVHHDEFYSIVEVVHIVSKSFKSTIRNHWINSQQDHNFGTCWTNGTNIAYINIPKCATSITKAVFQGVQRNYISDDLSEYHFFTVLRDPYSRWLSGVVEWIDRYDIVNIHNTDVFQRHEFIRFLLEARALDSHTEPQVHYFAGIDPARIDFLWMDKNYSQTLWKYMKEKGMPLYNIKKIGTSNVSTVPQRNAQQSIHDMINKHYQSDIKRKLFIDNNFIDSVQFYK